MAERKINVMIVDDSATARRILSGILSKGRDIAVTASVADPYEAVEVLKKGYPDVIMLDVQMPRMDGITFLKKIMKRSRVPVVMCSGITEKGSAKAMECLEAGAVDILAKPRISKPEDMIELGMRIRDVIRSAAQVGFSGIETTKRTLRPRNSTAAPCSHELYASYSADEIIAPPNARAIANIPSAMPPIIAVGASTGGTEAIRSYLSSMTSECPGIVMVQHMPEHFTRSFANRLNEIGTVRVREAVDGDAVEPGLALLARGDKHMVVRRRGAGYYVELKGGAFVSRHRPSVDVLFRSTAEAAGSHAVGVILTGMGDDGASGMLEMLEAGAYNFAQDEKSCVVFGMPKAAIKKGGVHETLPLEGIGPAVLRRLGPIARSV